MMELGRKRTMTHGTANPKPKAKPKGISFEKREQMFRALLGQKVIVTTWHTTFIHRQDGSVGEAPYTVKRHGTIKEDYRGNPVFVEYGKRKPHSFFDTPIISIKKWKR